MARRRREGPFGQRRHAAFGGFRAALVAALAARVAAGTPAAAPGEASDSGAAASCLAADGLLPAVPRRHWDTSDTVMIEDLVKDNVPVVLTGLSAEHLPGFDEWRCGSEEFVKRLKQVPKLSVKVNRKSPSFIYHTHPAEDDIYISKQFDKTHYDMYTQEDVSGEELVRSVCGKRSPLGSTNDTHYYFGGLIQTHLPTFLKDVKNTCLAQMPSQWNQCTKQSAQIWFTSPGVMSQSHNDGTNAFLVQVDGYKQVIMFPPNATMHTYPSSLHPGHRQSQIDTFAQVLSWSSSEFPKVNQSALEESSIRFPHVRTALNAASTVLLGPGEAIFLPYYWNHLIFALGSAVGTERVAVDASATGSISYSAWFDSDREKVTELGDKVQDGFNKGLEMITKSMAGLKMTRSGMIATAREFLNQISTQMGYPGFAQFHFDDRYAPLVYPATVEVEDTDIFCARFVGDQKRAVTAGAKVAKALNGMPAEWLNMELGDLYDQMAARLLDNEFLSQDTKVRPSSDVIQFMKSTHACELGTSRRARRRRRRQRKQQAA